MNIASWLKSRSSSRDEALSRYRRGMARAEEHDHQGAIDDFTATIDMPDAPSHVKGMALHDRALAHAAADNDQKGVDDLDAVSPMDKALVSLKTIARQRLTRMG
jgi:hypothetical protein